ncbi:hypothetical protein quinque_001372 [Culex quinquefasciatus]
MGRMDEVEDRWRICAIGSGTCLVIEEVDGRTSFVRRQVRVKWNRRGRPEEKGPSIGRSGRAAGEPAQKLDNQVEDDPKTTNPRNSQPISFPPSSNAAPLCPTDPACPYGDRHARRSQLYTVPVWELPVATPPFCSEEHPCRDHNRHRICQPLQPVDAGNQAIRWTLFTEVLGPSTNPGASRQKARRGSEYDARSS